MVASVGPGSGPSVAQRSCRCRPPLLPQTVRLSCEALQHWVAEVIAVIHHVQVMCPAGAEDRQRAFYTGVLGWAELPKPPLLAVRGGCWFQVPGAGELHVGADADFRPATKAHPAFVADVDEV